MDIGRSREAQWAERALTRFRDDLLMLRPWWPLLIPVLLWLGWHTYRRERAAVLRRRARRTG
ncbi:MAG: hypothetical protein KGS47_13650 [Chloroflexi bacterium]|nr:hypothetical protein [Chloroflexota bacterium]